MARSTQLKLQLWTQRGKKSAEFFSTFHCLHHNSYVIVCNSIELNGAYGIEYCARTMSAPCSQYKHILLLSIFPFVVNRT